MIRHLNQSDEITHSPRILTKISVNPTAKTGLPSVKVSVFSTSDPTDLLLFRLLGLLNLTELDDLHQFSIQVTWR